MGRRDSRSAGWPGVELRHLLALNAVAAERSFAGAARCLGYTQPAISHQIATLELAVGARLVHRTAGSKNVRLTEVGEAVHAHARSLIARMEAAAAEVDAIAGGSTGVLRLGTFPSVGARLLPKALILFRATFPAA